jgi:hypothetical protein
MMEAMSRATLLATMLIGCTHHRPARDVRELVGEELIVETTDLRKQDATLVSDGTELSFRTRSGELIGFGNLSRVIEIRRGRGALEGGAIGAGVGIVGGAILGYAGGGDPPSERGDAGGPITTAGQYAFIGAIVFGVLGGALGLVGGYAYGSHFVYAP